jgi:hypothetical protein
MAGSQPTVDAMLLPTMVDRAERSTNSIDGAARAEAIAADCQPRSSVPVARLRTASAKLGSPEVASRARPQRFTFTWENRRWRPVDCPRPT